MGAQTSKNKRTSKFIRDARASLRVTQQELGDILHVDRSQISKWEHGVSQPPGDVVFKVKDYLSEQVFLRILNDA